MDLEKGKNSSEINANDKPFTIFDIFFVLYRYKRRIFVPTIIVFVISVVLYFFVFDLIYFSEASVKSTSKSGGLLSSLSDNIPDIGALDDIGVSGGKSARELASYEEILTSRRCIEPLIDKFDIMNKDEYRFKEDAVKNFVKTNMEIKQDKLSGVLTVGVYDKDPVVAKEMVEFLLSQLDRINIELNVQSAKNNREFIEKRYNQAREDLTKSEDTLKSFQIVYGIAPDLQVKAAATSEFSMEAELKAEEVKLDVLKKILSPDQIEVKTQEAKISSIKNRISEIQNSTDLSEYLRLGNSPQIVMSYLRLQREVEIQSKIVSFLLPIFEQAKIEEKRETPTIMVLDKPYVAERKSKPKRLTMVVIFTFIGFVFSTSYYVLKYKWLAFKKTREFMNLHSNFTKQ